MIDKATMQDVWSELASDRSVIVLCSSVSVPDVSSVLFPWLRSLKPTYESSTEMQLPNGTWVLLYADGPATREAAVHTDTKKARVFVI